MDILLTIILIIAAALIGAAIAGFVAFKRGNESGGQLERERQQLAALRHDTQQNRASPFASQLNRRHALPALCHLAGLPQPLFSKPQICVHTRYLHDKVRHLVLNARHPVICDS